MTIVERRVCIDSGGDFKKRFIKTVARVSYDDDDFYSRFLFERRPPVTRLSGAWERPGVSRIERFSVIGRRRAAIDCHTRGIVWRLGNTRMTRQIRQTEGNDHLT
jgi:hypothetical protein